MSSLNRRYFPRLPPENDSRFSPVDPGSGCCLGALCPCYHRSERCFVASNCFVWSSAETGRPNPLVMGSSPILPTKQDRPAAYAKKLLDDFSFRGLETGRSQFPAHCAVPTCNSHGSPRNRPRGCAAWSSRQGQEHAEDPVCKTRDSNRGSSWCTPGSLHGHSCSGKSIDGRMSRISNTGSMYSPSSRTPQ